MDTSGSSNETDGEKAVRLSRMGRPGDGFDLTTVFALSASFIAGIMIAVGLLNLAPSSNEPEVAAPQTAGLARQVGEPAIETEVAGAVCEDQVEVLADGASSADVLTLWNTTVQSSGDACVAPFNDALGANWVMTDADLSIFGDSGSLYEFTSSEADVAIGLSIFLVAEDSQAGQAESLQLLINTLWGEQNFDWDRPCLETDRQWSGVIAADGLSLGITNCDA